MKILKISCLSFVMIFTLWITILAYTFEVIGKESLYTFNYTNSYIFMDTNFQFLNFKKRYTTPFFKIYSINDVILSRPIDPQYSVINLNKALFIKLILSHLNSTNTNKYFNTDCSNYHINEIVNYINETKNHVNEIANYVNGKNHNIPTNYCYKNSYSAFSDEYYEYEISYTVTEDDLVVDIFYYTDIDNWEEIALKLGKAFQVDVDIYDFDYQQDDDMPTWGDLY